MGEHIWQEECAIMAVSLPPTKGGAAHAVYDGLRLLQHRGQDGSGITVVNSRTQTKKGPGLVADVYPGRWLERQNGSLAIGHNRYATQGKPSINNLQPHRATCRGGNVYLASNGDLVNFGQLRRRLQRKGVKFRSMNDGELLAWLLATVYDRTNDMVKAIETVLQTAKGAYSAVAIFQRKLYVFRDDQGFRPLVMANMPGGGVAFASETIAFDVLRADPLTYQEVRAGEILEVNNGSITVHKPGHTATNQCVFEDIYFARPDSLVFGLPISLVRRRIGWQLAYERRLPRWKNAIVVPVPDSANEIARGVADVTGLPYRQALMRSHTSRRTFIESQQIIRDDGVKYKLNPDRFYLEGMVVILVDDSIVRSTTISKIVKMLLRAGAKAVHVLIGSPRIYWPCYMGIATPTRGELIANQLTIGQLTKRTEADSLFHLSLDSLKIAVGPLIRKELSRHQGFLRRIISAQPNTYLGRIREQLRQQDPDRFCYACFTGKYPVRIKGRRMV
ncbi:MAG: amidophosphoribosyltransferase [Patescibacteria group bacterium]|nr:amidophosphoribosyltransferase [Patescibacteria group bacterium]